MRLFVYRVPGTHVVNGTIGRLCRGDDLSHTNCTAGDVRRVAKTLKIDKHLRLHVKVSGIGWSFMSV